MNKYAIIACAALALVTARPPALRAQDPSILVAGTRMRLVTPTLNPAEQVGKLVSATSDTIVFRSDANPVTRTFAVSELTSIEVSGGQKAHYVRDALYGAVIGAGAGALLGAAAYKKPKSSELCFGCDRGTNAIAGAFLGAIAGTAIGAVVGAHDKSERWTPLRRSTKVAIAPSPGGVRLALLTAF